MSETDIELPPLEERPLVTFALFAYNQEKYIREAVEGAFSQTYEPLEIILSDDCSTDRTFEIMQEMAAEYRGNHKVKVRRSPNNKGVVLHISNVVDLANGQFIVVAAGDDISLPERTSIMVQLLQQEGTDFAASNYNRMAENGEIVDLNLENDYSNDFIFKVIDTEPDYYASGSTAAYRTSFLKGALKASASTISTGKLNNEDSFFAAYAVAIGKKPSHHTKSALINYRIISTSLSNYKPKDKTLRSEIDEIKREIFYSATRLALLTAILEISNSHSRLAPLLKLNEIKHGIRLSEFELSASNTRFFKRLYTLQKTKNTKELRIALARIFGINTLAWIRYIKKRIYNR